MEATPVSIKTIQIEEYYTEEKGSVYRVWRFAGKDEWNKEITPYSEIPYVEMEKYEYK